MSLTTLKRAGFVVCMLQWCIMCLSTVTSTNVSINFEYESLPPFYFVAIRSNKLSIADCIVLNSDCVIFVVIKGDKTNPSYFTFYSVKDSILN